MMQLEWVSKLKLELELDLELALESEFTPSLNNDGVVECSVGGGKGASVVLVLRSTWSKSSKSNCLLMLPESQSEIG